MTDMLLRMLSAHTILTYSYEIWHDDLLSEGWLMLFNSTYSTNTLSCHRHFISFRSGEKRIITQTKNTHHST